MKISKREDFGLIFMTILTKYHSRKFIPLSFVAKQTHLSPLFLKHIVSRLKDKGLVESKEGVDGGYRLAKDPRRITVADILSAISTNTLIPSCGQGVCRIKKETCLCFSFWDKVNRQLIWSLQKVNLWQFSRL